ncbi:MAG: hypothetical protein IJ730_07025 [Alphaproteobacteria bacterium]|nr:hypothetical protein [Alphaproteobacteria bacterium]
MIRIADLCAGIGGIHLGFEQAFGKETQSYFDTNRKLQKIEFTLVLKKSPSTTSDLIVLNNDSSSSFIDALTNLAHAGYAYGN